MVYFFLFFVISFCLDSYQVVRFKPTLLLVKRNLPIIHRYQTQYHQPFYCHHGNKKASRCCGWLLENGI
jgi:hypothetical protein